MATTKNAPRRGQNYLIAASDGLYVLSGATGLLKKIPGRNSAKVQELLKERQRLAVEITKALEEKGLLAPSVGEPTGTIDLPPGEG